MGMILQFAGMNLYLSLIMLLRRRAAPWYTGVSVGLSPLEPGFDSNHILNLVTSRGRKSGRKSASYNPAVTVVNRYSETGFSEVLSHLRHAHHTCENQ